jgi:hypothetical protein
MTERPTASKKRTSLSDNAFGWIGLALVLIAAIILDKGSPPHMTQVRVVDCCQPLAGCELSCQLTHADSDMLSAAIICRFHGLCTFSQARLIRALL